MRILLYKGNYKKNRSRRTYTASQAIDQIYLKQAIEELQDPRKASHQVFKKEANPFHLKNLSSKYMSPSEYISMSFYKERNKLVGTNNFLAWKKRTDLLLKENELLEH